MTVGTVLFDPLDPSIAEDPYPAYARLRRSSPVHYLPDHDVWAVSRYADVATVLRDPITFSSRAGMSPDFGGRKIIPDSGVGYRIGAPNVRVLIATDAPDHAIFRHAVAAAFTPSAVATLQPRVQRIAQQQVGQLLRAEEPDFFADVAEPVPALVLAELLGVPSEMHDEFRRWSAAITSDLTQSGSGAASLGRGLDMFRFFRRRMNASKSDGPPNLFDAIIRGQGGGITDQEVLAFCAFLLVAGIETTTSMLTNLLDALMRMPWLMELLRGRPELIPAAIEEGIRYDTSVQALWRGTTRDAELSGVTIPAGSRVLTMFGSANRDERKFEAPDEFNLERSPCDHLGFGAGPHFCLGTRFARTEMLAVLTELLAATRSIEPAGPAVRTGSIVLRGFTRMPIRVEAAHA